MLENFSSNKFLKFLKKEQREKILKNKQQIEKYNRTNKKQDENDIFSESEKLEIEVLFMIKYSVSLKFITKYFKITENKVKEIATKYKCSSQLFSSYTENTKARCFSRSQILRTCEEFNYICPMCFQCLDITKPKTLTGHHILPFAKGGLTSKDNCLPLHVSCHFNDFKLLHSALFDSSDPIYSAKYFIELKNKLKKHPSGMDAIIKQLYNIDLLRN